MLITTNTLLANVLIHSSLEAPSTSTAGNTGPPKLKACLVTPHNICITQVQELHVDTLGLSSVFLICIEHIYHTKCGRYAVDRWCGKLGDCGEVDAHTAQLDSHMYIHLSLTVWEQSPDNLEEFCTVTYKLSFQEGLRGSNHYGFFS